MATFFGAKKVYFWSAAKRRLARVNNTRARIPSIGAVYRHFPAGDHQRWRRVVEAAALTGAGLSGWAP